jgi:hypothetical protein
MHVAKMSPPPVTWFSRPRTSHSAQGAGRAQRLLHPVDEAVRSGGSSRFPRPARPRSTPGYGATGPTSNGRIISLSSCSTMWQCHTKRPGMSNLARTVVISSG